MCDCRSGGCSSKCQTCLAQPCCTIFIIRLPLLGHVWALPGGLEMQPQFCSYHSRLNVQQTKVSNREREAGSGIEVGIWDHFQAQVLSIIGPN